MEASGNSYTKIYTVIHDTWFLYINFQKNVSLSNLLQFIQVTKMQSRYSSGSQPVKIWMYRIKYWRIGVILLLWLWHYLFQSDTLGHIFRCYFTYKMDICYCLMSPSEVVLYFKTPIYSFIGIIKNSISNYSSPSSTTSLTIRLTAEDLFTTTILYII